MEQGRLIWRRVTNYQSFSCDWEVLTYHLLQPETNGLGHIWGWKLEIFLIYDHLSKNIMIKQHYQVANILKLCVKVTVTVTVMKK